MWLARSNFKGLKIISAIESSGGASLSEETVTTVMSDDVESAPIEKPRPKTTRTRKKVAPIDAAPAAEIAPEAPAESVEMPAAIVAEAAPPARATPEPDPSTPEPVHQTAEPAAVETSPDSESVHTAAAPAVEPPPIIESNGTAAASVDAAPDMQDTPPDAAPIGRQAASAPSVEMQESPVLQIDGREPERRPRDRPRDARPERRPMERNDRDQQTGSRDRQNPRPFGGVNNKPRPSNFSPSNFAPPSFQPQPQSQPLPIPPRNPNVPHVNVAELETKPMEELFELAREVELQGYTRMKRNDLISKLLQARTELEGNIFGDGVLEIIEDGFGFLRGSRFLPSQDDIYVSQSQIRRFGLRTGDRVSGQVRPPKDNEKFYSLLRVEAVNGVDPETARRRPSFDTLTPIFPLELIDLETLPNIYSTRLLNLVAPIGKGQRGLIVSPPKAGKTLLLKAIANGITSNSPDMHLMVCLIGERPEEVTDMRRSVEGEVISSTFDEPVEDHTKVAEMALERAKRLVEAGRDVTILMDSITRLARAYNLAVPPSGRTLSGGIDPVALYPPKRFFGAARNVEGGGSLTIVATCLVDTGSRMDDVIYEEFKGTGNMELHLDRKLAERRIYPSIDIQRSGTRREELLLDDATLRQVWTMRRMVSMLGGSEGTELLLGRLSKTQNNAEFLQTLTKDV